MSQAIPVEKVSSFFSNPSKQNKLYVYEIENHSNIQTLLRKNTNNFISLIPHNIFQIPRDIPNENIESFNNYISKMGGLNFSLGCFYNFNVSTLTKLKSDIEAAYSIELVTDYAYITNDDFSFLKNNEKLYVFSINEPIKDNTKAEELYFLGSDCFEARDTYDDDGEKIPRDTSNETMWVLPLQSFSRLDLGTDYNLFIKKQRLNKANNKILNKTFSIDINPETIINKIRVFAKVQNKNTNEIIENLEIGFNTQQCYAFPLIASPFTTQENNLQIYFPDFNYQYRMTLNEINNFVEYNSDPNELGYFLQKPESQATTSIFTLIDKYIAEQEQKNILKQVIVNMIKATYDFNTGKNIDDENYKNYDSANDYNKTKFREWLGTQSDITTNINVQVARKTLFALSQYIECDDTCWAGGNNELIKLSSAWYLKIITPLKDIVNIALPIIGIACSDRFQFAIKKQTINNQEVNIQCLLPITNKINENFHINLMNGKYYYESQPLDLKDTAIVYPLTVTSLDKTDTDVYKYMNFALFPDITTFTQFARMLDFSPLSEPQLIVEKLSKTKIVDKDKDPTDITLYPTTDEVLNGQLPPYIYDKQILSNETSYELVKSYLPCRGSYINIHSGIPYSEDYYEFVYSTEDKCYYDHYHRNDPNAAYDFIEREERDRGYVEYYNLTRTVEVSYYLLSNQNAPKELLMNESRYLMTKNNYVTNLSINNFITLTFSIDQWYLDNYDILEIQGIDIHHIFGKNFNVEFSYSISVNNTTYQINDRYENIPLYSKFNNLITITKNKFN